MAGLFDFTLAYASFLTGFIGLVFLLPSSLRFSSAQSSLTRSILLADNCLTFPPVTAICASQIVTMVQELQSQNQLATSQSDINRLEDLIHKLVAKSAEKDKKSTLVDSVSSPARGTLLKKVTALKKERDDLYKRLKHLENERTDPHNQVACQNDLFERTSAIVNSVERYGIDGNSDSKFFRWRPLVLNNGAPEYKFLLQPIGQKEKIDHLEGLTRRQERQIEKLEAEKMHLLETLKEKEAAWKDSVHMSPANSKASDTETRGVQTDSPETSDFDSLGDELQETKSLLSKVRSQMIPLKSQHVIELAKLHAKERSSPPRMLKAPSPAPTNDAEILHRLSDLEANLCGQVEAHSSKLEATLEEILRLREESSQDDKEVVMTCVSDLKATLQNRDEQIQELVSAVQASKDQATSAMEECTELRKELEKRRVEVQKAQKELEKLRRTQSATREQTNKTEVEELSKKVKSLTAQLEKKNEIHQRLNSRISQVESANSKLLTEIHTKKVSTIDKGFVNQLTERIRKLEVENAKLRAPTAVQNFTSADNNYAEATGEVQRLSEKDAKIILKQLSLVQRERDAARKQLLKTDANLKRTEKHNRLLLNRLKLQPSQDGYLRRAMSTPTNIFNAPSKGLAPSQLRDELNSAREDNAKLKIHSAKLEASTAKLEEQLQLLKMTRPYSPSLDKADTMVKGKPPSRTTGKTAAELEVLLLKMKSILDRTLAENTRLKRLLTRATNRMSLQSLQAENQRLRERLEQAEDATSAALAEHRIESDKSIAHLTSEYDKLRAQLLKASFPSQLLHSPLEVFGSNFCGPSRYLHSCPPVISQPSPFLIFYALCLLPLAIPCSFLPSAVLPASTFCCCLPEATMNCAV
ncbi:unnamed protein product [Taenia asiatica]|uniref:CEP209_CC5 domain-containing protein n=1 Tax=Taenia asiatica TaxID=60517 RepID=A0A158R983_TAEAS|nr:unnamed protein product [Taenia asiatica]